MFHLTSEPMFKIYVQYIFKLYPKINSIDRYEIHNTKLIGMINVLCILSTLTIDDINIDIHTKPYISNPAFHSEFLSRPLVI